MLFYLAYAEGFFRHSVSIIETTKKTENRKTSL